MSLSQSLSNAISGLNAAARGAELVSSNIANAATGTYGRRSLALSAQSPGGGVRVDGVLRHADRGLISDRRLSESGMRGGEVHLGILSRLEQLIGAAGQAGGIDDRLVALEAALISAEADPGSDLRLGQVLDRLHGLSGAVGEAATGIRMLRQEVEADIGAQVKSLNQNLARLERLNSDIARYGSSGHDTAGLLDQRQAVIDAIAALVPVREVPRGNGQIALITRTGETLLDGRAREIGFVQHNTIAPGMSFAGGGLAGLTIDGRPVIGEGGAGRLAGGTLGAAFALRDETLVAAQTGLDAIAADLIARLEQSGAPGLLTDAGAALDPADTDGISSRIAVNAAIDPARGGELRLLRDGLGAVLPGPIGENAQITAWLAALDAPRSIDGGTARSAAGHLAGYVAQRGADRLGAEEALAFASARWEVLRQTELAGGVDTDQELQILMQMEQAYAANAKVIQAVDLMMQQLLEL